jgi:hypothetical protein
MNLMQKYEGFIKLNDAEFLIDFLTEADEADDD